MGSQGKGMWKKGEKIIADGRKARSMKANVVTIDTNNILAVLIYIKFATHLEMLNPIHRPNFHA
jgi:hypothetical protein